MTKLLISNQDKKILAQILNKYPYSFYAYGSRVKGTAKKYSDLDLCFYDEIPWNVLSHLHEDLEESDLPFKVDLNAWKWMSPYFQELIRKDLIPIQSTTSK